MKKVNTSMNVKDCFCILPSNSLFIKMNAKQYKNPNQILTRINLCGI